MAAPSLPELSAFARIAQGARSHGKVGLKRQHRASVVTSILGQVSMPLPLPKNCRLDEKERRVNFEVELEGKNRKAFISFKALETLYPHQDPIGAVLQSSLIARKVAERIRVGDVEPIYLLSTMFDDKGR